MRWECYKVLYWPSALPFPSSHIDWTAGRGTHIASSSPLHSSPPSKCQDTVCVCMCVSPSISSGGKSLMDETRHVVVLNKHVSSCSVFLFLCSWSDWKSQKCDRKWEFCVFTSIHYDKKVPNRDSGMFGCRVKEVKREEKTLRGWFTKSLHVSLHQFCAHVGETSIEAKSCSRVHTRVSSRCTMISARHCYRLIKALKWDISIGLFCMQHEPSPS